MDAHRRISNTNKNTESKYHYFHKNYEYNFFPDKYDFDGDLFSPNPSFLCDSMDYHNNKSNNFQQKTEETLNNENTYNNTILNINKINFKENNSFAINNKTEKNIVNINNYNDKFSKVNFMHKLKRNVHNPKNREHDNILKQNLNADYYGATNAPQNENYTFNYRNNIPINYKIFNKLCNTTDDAMYGDNNNHLEMSQNFQIDNKYIHTTRMHKNDKNTLIKNRILFYDNSKFYYKSYINKMSKIKGKFNSNFPESIQMQLKSNDTNKGIDHLNNKFEYTLDIKNKLPLSFKYSNRSDNFKNCIYNISNSNDYVRNSFSQNEKEKHKSQLSFKKNKTYKENYKINNKNELSCKKNKETNHFNISSYINKYLHPREDCKQKQQNIVINRKKNLKDNLIYLSINPKEEKNIYNIHDLKRFNGNIKNISTKNNNLGYKHYKLRNSYINQTKNMVIKKDNSKISYSNEDIDQKNTKLKIYENLEIFENEFLNKNSPKDYANTSLIGKSTLFIENNKKTKYKESNESNYEPAKNTNHQKHTQNINQENDKVEIMHLETFNEANKIKESNEIKSDNRKHVINIPINFNLKRNFKGYKNYIETIQKKNKRNNNNSNVILNRNHRKSLHMDNLKKNKLINFNKSEINDKKEFKNSPLINKIFNEQNVHIENVFSFNDSFKSNGVKEMHDSYNINENNKENIVNEEINTIHENLMNKEQVLRTNDLNHVNHNNSGDNINTSFEENTNLYSNASNLSLHDNIIFKNYCNFSEGHQQFEELKPKDANNKNESNIENTMHKQINDTFNETRYYIKNQNNDNSNNHEILNITSECNYKAKEKQISNIIKTDFQDMDEKNDTNYLHDNSSNKINDEMIKGKKCNREHKTELHYLPDNWEYFKNVFSSNLYNKNPHNLSLNAIKPNEKDNVIENSLTNVFFLDDDTANKKKSTTEYNRNNASNATDTTTVLINKLDNEINHEASYNDEQNEYITNLFNIFDNIKSDHEIEEMNNTKHDIIMNEVNNHHSEGSYLNKISTQKNENKVSNEAQNQNVINDLLLLTDNTMLITKKNNKEQDEAKTSENFNSDIEENELIIFQESYENKHKYHKYSETDINIQTKINENTNGNKEENKQIYLTKEIEIKTQTNINHAKNNNNILEIQYNTEEQKDITPKNIKDTDNEENGAKDIDKEYFSYYTENQNENTKREPIENIIKSKSKNFISIVYNKNDEIQNKDKKNIQICNYTSNEHKISDDETFFTKETIFNDMDIIENTIEENNFTESIDNIMKLSNSNNLKYNEQILLTNKNFKSSEEENKAKRESNNLVENIYLEENNKLKENHEYDNKLKYSIAENIQIIKRPKDDIKKEMVHKFYDSKENNKNNFHKRVDKHNTYTNNEIINEFSYLHIKINKYNLFNSLNINDDRLNYINSLYNSFDYFNKTIKTENIKTNGSIIYSNGNDTNEHENLELYQKLFEKKIIKIFDFSLQENHLINNKQFDVVDTHYEDDYINEHSNTDIDNIYNFFDNVTNENAHNDTKNTNSIKSSTLNNKKINHILNGTDSDIFNSEQSKVKEYQNTVLKDSSENCNNMKNKDNNNKDEGSYGKSDDDNEDILYEDIKRNIWLKNDDFNKNVEKKNAMKYIQIESAKCIILFCDLYKIKYFQGMHDMIISLFYLNLHPHEIFCVFEKILHYYAPYLYLQNQDYYIHTIKNEYKEVNHNELDLSIQISNYNGKLFRLLCQFFFPYVSFFFDTSISDNWSDFFFVNLNFSKFNNVYFLLFKWMKLIEMKDGQNGVNCDFILYLLSFFKYKLKLIKSKIYKKEIPEENPSNNFKKFEEINDKIETSNKNIKQNGGDHYHKCIEENNIKEEKKTQYDEIGQKLSDIKNEISNQEKFEQIENNKNECKDTTNYEKLENKKPQKENIRKNKLSIYCTSMFSSFFEFNSSFDDNFEDNYNIHIEEIIKDIKNIKKIIPISIINFIQNYNSMYQKKELLLKPEESYHEKWKLPNDISKYIDENICLNIKISDLFHFHNSSRYYEFIFIRLIGEKIILSKLKSITPNNIVIDNFIEFKGVYEFLNYKQKLKHPFKNKNKLLYIIIQNNKENGANFINYNFNELTKKSNTNKEKNYSNDKNMNKRHYLNKVFLKRNNKENPNINENINNNATDKIAFRNFFTTLKKNNFKYVTILQENPDFITINIDKKHKNIQKQIDTQENTNEGASLKKNGFIFQMLKKVKNKIYKNVTINDDLNKYTHSKIINTQENNMNYVLKDYNFKIFSERRIRKITNYKNKKNIRYPKNDIRKKKSDKIKKSKTQDEGNNEHYPMNQNEEKDSLKNIFPKNVSLPLKKYNEGNYTKLGNDLKEMDNLKNHNFDLNVKKKNMKLINISPNVKNNIILKKTNKPKLCVDDNELNNILYCNLKKEKTENIQKKYILPVSKKKETYLTKNELDNTRTHANSKTDIPDKYKKIYISKEKSCDIKTNIIIKQNNDNNIGKNEKEILNTEKQKTFFETQESFFNDLLLDKVTHNKEIIEKLQI
ncbi:conserved Plasmodium protein, unknown function [Plasmodium berghei]|uniref:Uncharacterized protein n=2 Tax=Plasmodium berghei TaxID=5821 RepID=A0A509APF0_PLABA|nr:conserved Plasmodium protein, unknown function [Plasmodium berghei ANKA]SCM25788.1 conserved Plasmodium protein, unknown function [Plasmodium berghei]SCN27497.1 conserved Plasmodium protein, unknown function [Plasmodium berghei]SCO63924.1 conserved Plasmodium protein, unknown function [Plasmodium berghei]VUC57352.1 conserved Plasmodium protein, unknown function [Plasmodium berghei ANKA]|eukprot:XP_034423130.1 conserved Plasmodium protein, unknown function [Plasmodium berghei ANKA]